MVVMRKRVICATICLVALVGFVLTMAVRNTATQGVPKESGSAISVVPVVPLQPAVAVASAGTEPQQTPTSRGTLPYVLASETPFTKPLRLAAESLGARTLGLLSRNSLLIEADPETRAKLAADGRFKEPEEFRPSRKIDADLAKRIQAGVKDLEISVTALTDADREGLIELVLAKGGEILKGCLNDSNTFKVRLSAEVIDMLALRGDVQWMENFSRPHLMNNIAVNPEAMNVRSVWETHGLSGAGQVITTSDSGITYDGEEGRIAHPDLVNQVIGIKVSNGCMLNDINGHGTHTAGSILGDGTMSDGEIRGTAWGAKLIAWYCSKGGSGVYTPDSIEELLRPTAKEPPVGIEGVEIPVDFEPDPLFPETYQAYIHSASWGSDSAGTYTSDCRNFDRYLWKNPDFLPVVSAGNSGSAAQTIGSPAAAKNVLAVAATQNLRTEPRQSTLRNGDPEITAEYSSRGPCRDGRIKPDVAAPGTGVLSTRSLGVDYSYGIYNDYYAYDTGTSMACPLTAGSMALVREWLLKRPEFSDDDPERRPTAALMKAIVTGGARSLDTKPSLEQGWGRVNLEETLYPATRSVKLIDRIPFADDEELAWAVKTTEVAPLDVQLVWVDYPGIPGAAQDLVNDLDLIVACRDEGNKGLWYGNGGEVPDTKNNVESVRIDEAAPGTYIIIVECTSVLYDYLEGGAAALYIRGAFDPDVETPVPALVRIRERDLGFQSLRKAVSKVQDDETLELHDDVTIPALLTITNSCTIVSAAEDGRSLQIVRPLNGRINIVGDLGVDTGIRVLFDNVVFTSLADDTSAPLSPVGQTTAALKDVTGLGNILLYTSHGLELAGPLLDKIVVDCRATAGAGMQFGTASVSVAELDGAETYLYNPYNEEVAGKATTDGDGKTILIWDEEVEPPADEAVASYDSGSGPRYYRTLRQLFAAVGNNGEVVVYKDCLLTNAVAVSQNLRLTASPAGKTITFSGKGALTVSSAGSLAIDHIALTASDIRREHFITVDGGELTLGDGTDIHDVKGKSCSTVFVQNSGTVQMLDGAKISGCVCATDTTKLVNSAGVCLSKGGCLLDMFGGTITECTSSYYGAGVFVVNSAEVRVSGSASVYGNRYNGNPNNIYLDGGWSRLVLSGEAYGYIGVEYPTSLPKRNGVDGVFASIDGPTQAEAQASLLSFFNDYAVRSGKAPLVAVLTNDGGSLQWAAAPEGPQPVPELVADVRVVSADGSESNFYRTIGDGFAVAKDGDRVELVRDAYLVEDVSVTNAAAIVFDGCGKTVHRLADVSVFVPSDTSLTLTNVVLSGALGGTTTMVRVNGGSLTMEDGAVICDVSGSGDRARGGVVVWAGTFTMNPGAVIRNCSNAFIREQDGSGCGGGLLVDYGVAYLNGGTITGCSAYQAGGVFIGNKSRVYVKGDLLVADNTSLAGEKSDLIVHDLSQLTLVGELAGEIGFREGISADPNVIGCIDPDYFDSASQDELVTDARRFRHDLTGDYGAVATNGTEILLVWCSAVDPDGIYAKDDEIYGILEGAEDIPVEIPMAVEGLVYTAAEQTGVLPGIGYALVDNVATNAGSYVARAILRKGFVWSDAASSVKEIAWSIARAPLAISAADASKKEGASDPELTYMSEGLLGDDRIEDVVAGALTREPGEAPGTYAILQGTLEAADGNYEIASFASAVFTIEGSGDDPSEEIVCLPFAFTAIERVDEDTYDLRLAPGVKGCRYTLLSGTDLETNGWQVIAGPKVLTSDGEFSFENVRTSDLKRFWKVTGANGTK